MALRKEFVNFALPESWEIVQLQFSSRQGAGPKFQNQI
jgi:hypothetical protein